MFRPYQYLEDHAMEAMHEFIETIFSDVWCKAPHTEYGLHLFQENEKLHHIMEHFLQLDSAGELNKPKFKTAKNFYYSVNGIYLEFQELDDDEIENSRQLFNSNNDVARLCSGTSEPITYDSLPESSLNQKLKDFFKNLYSGGFWTLAIVEEQLGSNLGDFYRQFIRLNNSGLCHFCWLQPIDNEFDPTREAFDHFLPKSKYPFNSVNLRNLAPACHKCNSGNKRDQDPLRKKDGTPRQAFYPYGSFENDLQISINFVSRDWQNFTDESIELELHSANYPAETETWDELYKIKQRYRARCCGGEHIGRLSWLNKIDNESRNYSGDSDAKLKAYRAEMARAEESPLSEDNFLRKPFLEACHSAGLFYT